MNVKMKKILFYVEMFWMKSYFRKVHIKYCLKTGSYIEKKKLSKQSRMHITGGRSKFFTCQVPNDGN